MPKNDRSAIDVDRRQQVAEIRSKWGWFLTLGFVLAGAGVLAVVLPAVSEFATSVVLGAVLVVAGVTKMIQSLQIKQWGGFVWQELTGAVEVVGGILIYFNPLKGAVAVTLLIALVFLVQGILQIALAANVPKQEGKGWFVVSGLAALAASAALAFKLPFTSLYPPSTIAGISLGIAGLAYVLIALALRRAGS